jgi:hypothetical protein
MITKDLRPAGFPFGKLRFSRTAIRGLKVHQDRLYSPTTFRVKTVNSETYPLKIFTRLPGSCPALWDGRPLFSAIRC